MSRRRTDTLKVLPRFCFPNGLQSHGIEGRKQKPVGRGIMTYPRFCVAPSTSARKTLSQKTGVSWPTLVFAPPAPLLSLQAAFDKFDRSHGGLITARDLRSFLGKELGDDDIDRMLKEAGLHHGGR